MRQFYLPRLRVDLSLNEFERAFEFIKNFSSELSGAGTSLRV